MIKTYAVKCHKPRKSKDSGCQNSDGVNANSAGIPQPDEDGIDKIDRNYPQNTPHEKVQYPLLFHSAHLFFCTSYERFPRNILVYFAFCMSILVTTNGKGTFIYENVFQPEA